MSNDPYWLPAKPRGLGFQEHEAGLPGALRKGRKSSSNMVLQPFRGHNIFWLDTPSGRP